MLRSSVPFGGDRVADLSGMTESSTGGLASSVPFGGDRVADWKIRKSFTDAAWSHQCLSAVTAWRTQRQSTELANNKLVISAFRR